MDKPTDHPLQQHLWAEGDALLLRRLMSRNKSNFQELSSMSIQDGAHPPDH